MEKLWDEAKAHIDDLEKAKAPRADWAVHVEVPVIDIKDNQTLELVLTENQVPEPDKLRAREFFEQEYPVTYFGYVGFWALVVFERDQDRAKVVFRD